MERRIEMGRRVHHICEINEEENAELRRLASSRTHPFRTVQRAKLIVSMLDDNTLTASQASKKVGFKSLNSGACWVKRFNEDGIQGLADKPKSGKPRIHSDEVRGQLIDLALQKPRSLGYPFELWTLIRLQTAFKERTGIYLSDSTIWVWLKEEGLNWKRQQSWFREVEKQDEEFVEKRGPL